MIDDGQNIYLESQAEYDDVLHTLHNVSVKERYYDCSLPTQHLWEGPRSVWLLPEMGFWHRLYVRLFK